MKCNLDCRYCYTDIYGGHNNDTAHPPLSECLRTIDFMFEYADIYMASKPRNLRYVVLNVYGGESLHHPDIVEILSAVRNKYIAYQDRWHLIVTTTTNAIVSAKKLATIIPLIDEFTVSFHAGATDKQRTQFKENLLTIQKAGVRQKCVVLMHPEPEYFAIAQDMINWLDQHNIRYLPRQIDSKHQDAINKYKHSTQILWLENLYNRKTFETDTVSLNDIKKTQSGDFDISNTGRACCGGRQVCTDQNFKSRHFWVNNQFRDWYCSVNHFFLFVKQVNGEIFVNKDCKMNFQGQVGPIGNLANATELLATTRQWFSDNTMPVIQCKKPRCMCGLCAPKALTLETYQAVMKKYSHKI